MTDFLPNNPNDVDEFKTGNNLYVFNKEDRTWKSLGLIDLNLVSEDVNGLIYPELYEKIALLKNVYDKGINNFSLTNKKAYFYLFNNSDRLLRFTFDNNLLYIDINRSILINKIVSRTFCVGPRGNTGPTGKTGYNGAPANREKYISQINKTFEINIKTYTDQPVSVRGFRKQKQIFEILVYNNEKIDYFTYNKYFKSLEFNDNILKGELIEDYDLKARQRGPNGHDGNNGIGYLKPIQYLRNNIALTSAVVNFRTSAKKNQLVWKKNDLIFNNCVLGVNAQELLSGSNWIGVEVTTELCKIIEVVNPEITLNKLTLDLPQWTPLPGCYDQSRYGMANFDWYSKLNLPFEILPNPVPKVNSCAIPFWFCGNSGNEPCDGSMSIVVPKKVYNNDLSSSSSKSLSSLSSSSSLSSKSAAISDISSISPSSVSLSSVSPSSDSSESPSSDSSESPSSDSSQSPSSESLASPSSESLSSVSPLSESSLSPLSPSSDSSQVYPCIDCTGVPTNTAILTNLSFGPVSVPANSFNAFPTGCVWRWYVFLPVQGYGVSVGVTYYSSGPDAGKWTIQADFSEQYYPNCVTPYQLIKVLSGPVCSGGNIVVDIDLPFNKSGYIDICPNFPRPGLPGTVHLQLS